MDRARHRWCLTGTPIQNSLDDLGSLVRFLRVPLLDTVSMFQKHMIPSSKEDQSVSLWKLQLLLKSICLRRPKELIRLPEPTVSYKYLRLDAIETEQYNEILTEFSEAADDAASDSKSKKSFSVVFQALNRLRLLCDRGTLEILGDDDMDRPDPEDTLAQLQETSRAICHYCSADISSIGVSESTVGSAILTDCLQLMCIDCLSDHDSLGKQSRRGKDVICPLCKKAVSKNNLPNSSSKSRKKQSQGKHMEYSLISGGHSSKLFALSQDIEEHMHSTKRFVETLMIRITRFPAEPWQ